MKALVTGATGFVGPALLSRFMADGTVVSSLVRRHSDALLVGVEQLVGDLCVLQAGDCRASLAMTDKNTLAMTLKNTDVVVHTAARAHIMRDEVSDPMAEYRRVNRDATLALARLAAQAGVKRFVFVSSVKVNVEMTRPGAGSR